MTLIDRLSKLEGPNEYVDVEIALVTDFWPKDKIDKVVTRDNGEVVVWFTDIYQKICPAYTASVDAAIALAERVLPGHQTGYLPSFFKDRAYAGIVSEKGKAVDLLKSTIEGGATPAIALCIALLRAKESV